MRVKQVTYTTRFASTTTTTTTATNITTTTSTTTWDHWGILAEVLTKTPGLYQFLKLINTTTTHSYLKGNSTNDF